VTVTLLFATKLSRKVKPEIEARRLGRCQRSVRAKYAEDGDDKHDENREDVSNFEGGRSGGLIVGGGDGARGGGGHILTPK